MHQNDALLYNGQNNADLSGCQQSQLMYAQNDCQLNSQHAYNTIRHSSHGCSSLNQHGSHDSVKQQFQPHRQFRQSQQLYASNSGCQQQPSQVNLLIIQYKVTTCRLTKVRWV